MIDIALVLQFFALIDPIASFPFLFAAKKKNNIHMIALKATITAFVIAILMLYTGPWLFRIFGIGIDSFKVAGGVVLFLLGIHMINPKVDDDIKADSIDGLTTLIATPMLTGPAVISFITVKSIEVGQTQVLFSLIASFFIVGAVFLIFASAVDKVNMRLLDILSRILGLFLTAVAVEMVFSGIVGLLHP